MVEVSISLLSADKENIVKIIYDLEVAGTNYFHIDVMDGKFVEKDNTNTMRQYTEYIKQIANTKSEVHLMVEDVESYAKSYIDMEVNCIIFHIESCKTEKQVLELISYIKENNIQVGLTINPKTAIEKLYNYLPYIHKVLIMSVEPGEGGQEFIEGTLDKIHELNVYAYENGLDIDIEVDGGINDNTAKKVVEAGANILVAGSYIINSGNYKEAIKKLKD
ncbi:MAG: ribulose-phosphate 3-epimerase [Clostridiaceae bacterium]|nr:ribulose-phosphate 3-epimerase [Clostridiaceae bacterium]